MNEVIGDREHVVPVEPVEPVVLSFGLTKQRAEALVASVLPHLARTDILPAMTGCRFSIRDNELVAIATDNHTLIRFRSGLVEFDETGNITSADVVWNLPHIKYVTVPREVLEWVASTVDFHQNCQCLVRFDLISTMPHGLADVAVTVQHSRSSVSDEVFRTDAIEDPFPVDEHIVQDHVPSTGAGTYLFSIDALEHLHASLSNWQPWDRSWVRFTPGEDSPTGLGAVKFTVVDRVGKSDVSGPHIDGLMQPSRERHANPSADEYPIGTRAVDALGNTWKVWIDNRNGHVWVKDEEAI